MSNSPDAQGKESVLRVADFLTLIYVLRAYVAMCIKKNKNI